MCVAPDGVQCRHTVQHQTYRPLKRCSGLAFTSGATLMRCCQKFGPAPPIRIPSPALSPRHSTPENSTRSFPQLKAQNPDACVRYPVMRTMCLETCNLGCLPQGEAHATPAAPAPTRGGHPPTPLALTLKIGDRPIRGMEPQERGSGAGPGAGGPPVLETCHTPCPARLLRRIVI